MCRIGCILLTSSVPTTWSPILQEAVKAEELWVVDYDLVLDYDYWNYCKCLKPQIA
jgi:tRNA (guanine37-N1)-methyltransferase